MGLAVFSNRTYDLDIIYRAVKKARNLLYSDTTDYMLMFVKLGNSNQSKGASKMNLISVKGKVLELQTLPGYRKYDV